MILDPTEECYVFASYTLYPKLRSLLKEGELVPVGGRALDMLMLFVARAGQVISLGELMSHVWPSVTVEEANLRVQVAMLRKALSQCDEARRAIETVPLRGYCFILPVRHHPAGIEGAARWTQDDTALPKLLTPVVGRGEAMATVCRALEAWRLVTITGPGGIGKTTVAVAAASQTIANLRGDLVFVDLSPVADGIGAVLLMLDALGLKPGPDPQALLCDHLADRAMLLVLDTCEHIVEPIAALVESLLAHCTDLRLLVTSREALRVHGEWTHCLAALTFPAVGEAVDEANWSDFSALVLFAERVRSCTRFDISREDLPVLAQICRRLDGVALALEFAAARVADLGLRTLADLLDDRFSILTRGRRTAVPRHQTLSATLDWSYRLLDEDEQRMLHHIAHLEGPLTAEHAMADSRHAICLQPAKALSSLYEKSLLSVDMSQDAPAYRLLDTTRAYVIGRTANVTPDDASLP